MDRKNSNDRTTAGVIAATAIIASIALLALAGLTGGICATIDENAGGSEGEMTGAAVSAASVTTSINYQGRLTDSAGEPLTGPYGMFFRLYDAPSGGTILYDDLNLVNVADGLFNTGIDFDQSYFDGRELWLGVTVGTDSEMTPRQELRPVPYALSLVPGAKIIGSAHVALYAESNIKCGIGVHGIGGKYGGYFTTDQGGTWGDHTAGVNATTTHDYSDGVCAVTSGNYSEGVHASTYGYRSAGIFAETTGNYSDGVCASTTGFDSEGVHASTYGYRSAGVFAETTGIYSKGVYASTTGFDSEGVFAETTGSYSEGVHACTYGDHSYGVRAYSDKYYGIYADTGRSDREYGVYTPDKMYAHLGYDTSSSDVAEYFPTPEDPEPGTVMVIDPAGGSKLRFSTKAYDTSVAGIVSTAPGVSLGTKEDGNDGERLIAVAGRVPCKVDASYAAIEPGDLLTTSDTRGHAMKAQPVEIGGIEIYRPGTTIGKALEQLDSGTGTIEVLVTLQ